MLTLAPFFAPDDVTRPRLQKLEVGVITRLAQDNPDGVFTS